MLENTEIRKNHIPAFLKHYIIFLYVDNILYNFASKVNLPCFKHINLTTVYIIFEIVLFLKHCI